MRWCSRQILYLSRSSELGMKKNLFLPFLDPEKYFSQLMTYRAWQWLFVCLSIRAQILRFVLTDIKVTASRNGLNSIYSLKIGFCGKIVAFYRRQGTTVCPRRISENKNAVLVMYKIYRKNVKNISIDDIYLFITYFLPA